MATYILGKKQTSKNESFVCAWQRIDTLVSREEAERLVQEAADYVLRKTQGKKVAYAWSGGKDSLALQVVMERAGIERCCFCTASVFEFPEFIRWCEANKPAGCTTIDNPDLNWAWIERHPKMLFGRESRLLNSWYASIQRNGWKQYNENEGLDMLLVGKRIQDGNFIGKGDDVYLSANGVTIFSPIAKWRHEDVLAVIHYFKGHVLPPLYSWKDGYIIGTGPWTNQPSWQAVYDIDPSVVQDAAQHCASARDFLATINNK